MDWLPVWARSAGWHRSPSRSRSPTRRHKRKRHSSTISSSSGEGAANRQQTEYCCNSGSSNLPERASSPPPPPLPPPKPSRRLAAAVALSLSVCVAAAVLLQPEPTRLRQQETPPSSTQGVEAGRGTLSELPFLEGKDGAGEGKVDTSNWVRVRSSTAMHPAMYVPGDGMVYCPIAKVSRETRRYFFRKVACLCGFPHPTGRAAPPPSTEVSQETPRILWCIVHTSCVCVGVVVGLYLLGGLTAGSLSVVRRTFLVLPASRKQPNNREGNKRG